MDEVDEIDENHVESNDAFAAYVIYFQNKIINDISIVSYLYLDINRVPKLTRNGICRLQKEATKERIDLQYIALNLVLLLNN